MLPNQLSYQKITCLGGVLVSAVIGFAEAKLHYSSVGFGSNQAYFFFTGVSDKSLYIGHFTASFAACFYLIGFAHIFSMTKEKVGAFGRSVVPMLFSYGVAVGSIWLGSRVYLAKISKLAYGERGELYTELLSEFSFLNESLLWGTRFTILIGSLVLSYLILSSKTYFPKYLAVFSPIFTAIYCFVIYYFTPSMGQYLMPIAMNVAFFVFFSLSFAHLLRNEVDEPSH